MNHGTTTTTGELDPPSSGRQADGRFAIGNKISPGRAAGSRHKVTLQVEALLGGEAEKLTRKAIEKALEGDAVALRLCLDRLAPPRRAPSVDITLPLLGRKPSRRYPRNERPRRRRYDREHKPERGGRARQACRFVCASDRDARLGRTRRCIGGEKMIGFSDTQLATLTEAVGRVEHGKRNAFMRRVASELARGRVECGRPIDDAELTRAISAVERSLSAHLAA